MITQILRIFLIGIAVTGLIPIHQAIVNQPVKQEFNPFLVQYPDRYEIGNENGKIQVYLNHTLAFVAPTVKEPFTITSSSLSISVFLIAIGSNTTTEASLLITESSSLILNFTSTNDRPGVKIGLKITATIALPQSTVTFAYPWPTMPTDNSTISIVNFGNWQHSYADIAGQFQITSTYSNGIFQQNITIPLLLIGQTITLDPTDGTDTTAACSPRIIIVSGSPSTTVCTMTVTDINFPLCGTHCHPTGNVFVAPGCTSGQGHEVCASGAGSCALSNVGAAEGQCTITYTAVHVGSSTENGNEVSYPGDSFHSASSSSISPPLQVIGGYILFF